MATPIPSTGERMLGLKSRHYANMGWIGQNGPKGGGTAPATATATAKATETGTDGTADMDGETAANNTTKTDKNVEGLAFWTYSDRTMDGRKNHTNMLS